MAAHILNDYVVVNCVSPDVDLKCECIHFLTHIGRHQTVLSNIISSHIQKVYTSEFNVWYLKTFFEASSSKFVGVPLWTKRKVKSKGQTITFEFLNANHCPGAVMVLIKGDFGVYLYTGNCRYNPAMLDYSSLRPYSQGLRVLDKLYVDAAYLKLEHNFPKREVVVQQILDFIREHSEEKIYICCRLLGKEDILFRIALELDENICVSPEKLKILNKLGYRSNVFTSELSCARLRVVDVNQITGVKMKRRRMTEKCVGIILSACSSNAEKLKKHGIYVFPASDHSSATETKLMIKSLKAKDIYLLNEESTLSGHLISCKKELVNQNNDYDSSSVIHSPFILNQKIETKCLGKKKLSLRLNSRGDENQPPSNYDLSVSVQKVPSSKGLILKENQLSQNNVVSKSKVNTFNRSKMSKSYASNKKKLVMSLEPRVGSFLIDENAQTGFSSSGSLSDARSQKAELSPSYPPSVSDIGMTQLSISDDSPQYRRKQLLNFSRDSQESPDQADVEGCESPVETQAEHVASKSFSNIQYHSLSPSYPPSVTNIVLTQHSGSLNRKSFPANVPDNNSANAMLLKSNSYVSDRKRLAANKSKTVSLQSISARREKSVPSENISSHYSFEKSKSIQFNLLSPSFPPSASNIVSTRESDSVQQSNSDSDGNILPHVSRTDVKSVSPVKAKRKNSLKKNSDVEKRLDSTMHLKPHNYRMSHRMLMIHSENLNQIPEINETREIDEMNEPKECHQPAVLDMSECSLINCSDGDNIKSMIQTKMISQNQTSFQLMAQTKFMSLEDPTENATININKPLVISETQRSTSDFSSNLTQSKSQDPAISEGPSSLLHKENISKIISVNEHNTSGLPKCKFTSQSLVVSDLIQDTFTKTRSVFLIENMNGSEMQLCTSLNSVEIPLGKFNPIYSGIPESELSKNNLQEFNRLVGLSNSTGLDFLSNSKSLFTTDALNKSKGNKMPSCKNSTELFVNNSNALDRIVNSNLESGKCTRTTCEHMSESNDKNQIQQKAVSTEKALADQTTVLFISHQVSCEIHHRPTSRQTIESKTKSDLYEQPTVLSGTSCMECTESPGSSEKLQIECDNAGSSGLTECNPDVNSNENDMGSSHLLERVVDSAPLSSSATTTSIKRSQRKKKRKGSSETAKGSSLSQSSESERKFISLPLLRSSMKPFPSKQKQSASQPISLTNLDERMQNNRASVKSINSKCKTNYDSDSSSKMLQNSTKSLCSTAGSDPSAILPTNSTQMQENITNAPFTQRKGSISSFSVINKDQITDSTLPTNIKNSVDLFSSDFSLTGNGSTNNSESLKQENRNKSMKISSQYDISTRNRSGVKNNSNITNAPLSQSQPSYFKADIRNNEVLSSNQPVLKPSFNKKLFNLFTSDYK